MFTPSPLFVFTALLVTLWLVMIPPFHRIALDATLRRNPGMTPQEAHPIAFTTAVTWPAIMVWALLR